MEELVIKSKWFSLKRLPTLQLSENRCFKICGMPLSYWHLRIAEVSFSEMCMIGPSNCVLLIYFLYLTIGARVTPVVLLGQSYLEVTGEFTVSLCVCFFFTFSSSFTTFALQPPWLPWSSTAFSLKISVRCSYCMSFSPCFAFKWTQDSHEETKQLTFTRSFLQFKTSLTSCQAVGAEEGWTSSSILWVLCKLHLLHRWPLFLQRDSWFPSCSELLCVHFVVWFSTQMEPDAIRLGIDFYWSARDWEGNGQWKKKRWGWLHQLNRGANKEQNLS